MKSQEKDSTGGKAESGTFGSIPQGDLMRAMIESSPAAQFLKDVTGRYLYVNRRFEDEFGLAREQILGRTDPEIFPREQAEVFQAHDDLVLRHGLPCWFEEWVPSTGGARIHNICRFPLLEPASGAQFLSGIALGAIQRTQADEALGKANPTLQSIFDSAPVAVLSMNLEGRITHWNRGAERMFGWPAAETLGRICPTVAGEDLADYLEMVTRVARHGAEDLVRIRHKKSGEHIHARLHPAPLRDADGVVRGVMVIMEDVTEKIRAEEALRQSDARLSQLIETALDAIIVVNEAELIQVFNKGAQTIFGYRAEEVLGQPLSLLLAARVAETHRRHLQAFAAAPEVPRLMAPGRSVSGIRKDGSEFPAEASISKQVADGRRTFTAFLRDITERKQAEDALRESEERFRVIFDRSPLGIALVDLNGRPFLANSACQRMLGRTAEELSRLVFTEFTHPEDRDADMGLYRQLLTGERDSYQIEKRYYRKDGECVWAGLAVTLIRDPGGQPKFALSIVEDITDRKRAERASLRSERQLRALSARLETLREEERARISREIHDELGQLLTGLKMDLRWIEHQLDAFGHDRRVNPILDKLVAAAELADATIKTVQRIAEELRPGVLDKLGLPIALQYEVGRFEARTGIPCRLVMPDDVPPLRPDAATAFFRIFQEALTNVIRHAKATVVEVEFDSYGGDHRLEVRDNGVGITGVDLTHPTSLGLLGMRERARLLGGDVMFTPRSGGGTVVSVRIPGGPISRQNV